MEFREILDSEGLSLSDFADLMGLASSTVRNGVSRGSRKRGSKMASVWVRAFVLGYRLGCKK